MARLSLDFQSSLSPRALPMHHEPIVAAGFECNLMPLSSDPTRITHQTDGDQVERIVRVTTTTTNNYSSLASLVFVTVAILHF